MKHFWLCILGGFLSYCNSQHGNIADAHNCVLDMCNNIFADKPDLRSGCLWYTDWFRAANNPTMRWQKLDSCPAALTDVSGMR